MINIAPDPHHNGENKWKFENGKLYHNTGGSKDWVKVRKISSTKDRILAIAKLIINNS